MSSFDSIRSGYLHAQYQPRHHHHQQPPPAPPYPTTPDDPSSFSSQGYFPPIPEQQHHHTYSSSPSLSHVRTSQAYTGPRRTLSTSSYTNQHHPSQQPIPIRQPDPQHFQRQYHPASPPPATYTPQAPPMYTRSASSPQHYRLRRQYRNTYSTVSATSQGSTSSSRSPDSREKHAHFAPEYYDDDSDDDDHNDDDDSIGDGQHESYYGVLDPETEREYKRRCARDKAFERRPTLGHSLLSVVDKVGRAFK
ncbi:hypothetical protein ACJQWK_07240 [Exserohilum turcicum]|uniref:Uncharacterized protein n=1 Tax=Exserohilum turcicum (strain 28A) TaxID=671987 RepID=R0IHP0_EXST2|nr:uncharacterized protein SETTUDRAFT_179223 [Exserohilum turcica Et28A]EOA84496.1 hypothetical protein SETTUDRAFT_179223 [Exserohilum turcica Et28A]